MKFNGTNWRLILDLVYAYNKLLPPTKYGKQLGEKSLLTSSTISFYWGLKRKVEGMHVHNVFLAEEYKASFDDIFKEHKMPADPSFYIHVPSLIDPSCKLIFIDFFHKQSSLIHFLKIF